MIPTLSTNPSSRGQRFETAEEYAHAQLRELILSGELPGGTKLQQNELADRLGVSRMPVRQAIVRLENEGLVVQRPNRGAFVTLLGPEGILELFEMRSVLEGLALRLAAPQMRAEEQAEIRRLIGVMDSAGGDVSVWIQRHDDLHEFLCACAKRPRLAANARQMRVTVAPYIRVYLNAYESAEMAGFEHHTLLRAIQTKDPAHCEEVMREHILLAAKGVVDFIQVQAKKKIASEV